MFKGVQASLIRHLK